MAEEAKPTIYGLHHPITGELRYIGKADDVERRLKSHRRDMWRRSTPLYCWMRALNAEGLVPVVTVLEAACADWRESERRLIAEARASAARLLNLADGGDQPFCPKEVRANNGRRAAKSRNARIWRLKRSIGQALRDGRVSDSAREKLRQAAAIAPHIFGEYASL